MATKKLTKDAMISQLRADLDLANHDFACTSQKLIDSHSALLRAEQEIDQLRHCEKATQGERRRLATLLFPEKNPLAISWDDLAIGLSEHAHENAYVELREYVEGLAKEESIDTKATTHAMIEALHDALTEARERADDAEKERDAAQAKIEETRGDAVELLKDLGFDVMPLLPVGSWQDAPSLDDPLVVDRLRAQRAS
jgi:hypothetical protein